MRWGLHCRRGDHLPVSRAEQRMQALSLAEGASPGVWDHERDASSTALCHTVALAAPTSTVHGCV